MRFAGTIRHEVRREMSINTAETTSRSAGRRRILLAEDDVEMRRLLAQSLRVDGHEIIEVEDGTELLQYTRAMLTDPPDRIQVDMIVSDVVMPGLNGLEVLAALRRMGFKKPFILVTAFGDDELHQKARGLGAAACFDKPFDLDDLRMAVSNLVISRVDETQPV
jgi:CheY-like chemotaxis protein